MERTNIELSGTDGTRIFTAKWLPDRKDHLIGCVLFAHGMGDHKERYADTAEYMTTQGLAFYALDHRGHGESVKQSGTRRGFLSATNGWHKAVDDLEQVRRHIHAEHPELPIFLMGHSFGSLLLRSYITSYHETINGVILISTAGHHPLLYRAGQLIAFMEAKRIGLGTPSKRLDAMNFGPYNRAFRPNRTTHDWISRDDSEVDTYLADPAAGFICSVGFYRDMLGGLFHLHSRAQMKKIPSDLPILLAAGTADPLSHGGKLLPGIAARLHRFGVKDVEIRCYPGARHELLKETNRAEVWDDIWQWIAARL